MLVEHEDGTYVQNFGTFGQVIDVVGVLNL